MRRRCLLRHLVHLWGARAKHAVLMRISSNMLPQRATYFSDGPHTQPPLLAFPRPRRAVLAILKTRNQLNQMFYAFLPCQGCCLAEQERIDVYGHNAIRSRHAMGHPAVEHAGATPH